MVEGSLITTQGNSISDCMWLNIYALSFQRDINTIDRFLQHFCVPDETVQHDDFEIWIGENQKYGMPEILLPVATQQEATRVGVANPTYGFAFYFDGGNIEIKYGIIQFTFDGKIVFGLSIEDKQQGDKDDSWNRAIELAKELIFVTQGCKSFVSCEYPPPIDEDEFDSDMLVWQEFN